MVKTTKGEESKNKLIECAAELFLQKGYNATGINDILAMTGMAKGSFYFHFASKKDLAINVSAHYENKIVEWILKTSKGKKWPEFITNLTADMIKGAENKKNYGCPFAAIGLEIAFSEPDISEHYYQSMKKLIKIFAHILKFSNVSTEKVDNLSNRAFVMYEGYLLYYRVGKDIAILKMMQRDLIEIYKEALEVEE